MLQLPAEARRIRQVVADHPSMPEMCLQYVPLGSCEDLQRQLAELVVDRTFLADPRNPAVDAPDVRSHMEFELRLRGHRLRLEEVTGQVCTPAAQILAAYHAVSYQLGGKLPPIWGPIVDDIRDQLAHLLPRGFLLATPYAWLLQYPRYLRGITVRLQRLANAGFNRDLRQMGHFSPLWQRYLARKEKHRAHGVHDPSLETYRWLLEEMRVSLFAQELGTVAPVSPKRLEAQWAQVRP
jgi:ATP-dependent helicase HrpA